MFRNFSKCFHAFPNVPKFPSCWEWLGHGKKLLGHGKEMRAGKLTGASGTCSNARLAHAFAHDLWLRRRNTFPQHASVYFVFGKTEKIVAQIQQHHLALRSPPQERAPPAPSRRALRVAAPPNCTRRKTPLPQKNLSVLLGSSRSPQAPLQARASAPKPLRTNC